MRIDRTFPIGRARLLAFAAAFAVVVCGWAATQAHAFVYWTNEGDTTIGRANLDGSGANQSFISGASAPIGLAVDGQHVYWTNTPAVDPGNTIGRANLGGTGSDQSFITGANLPVGVAVDGQHVYWANNQSGTIGRANLDGTGVIRASSPGPPTPSTSRSTASTSTGSMKAAHGPPLSARSGARTSTARASIRA